MAKTKSIRADLKELVPGLIGIVISILTTIALTVIFAIFITNEYIDIKLCRPIATVIHFIAVFWGLYISLLIFKIPYHIVIITTGALYLLLLCNSLLFFDGISVYAVIETIPSAAGTILAILLDKKRRMRRNKRHLKIRSR